MVVLTTHTLILGYSVALRYPLIRCSYIWEKAPNASVSRRNDYAGVLQTNAPPL